MKRLKLWIGLVALFFSGVSVGALGAWIITEHRMLEIVTHGRHPVPRMIMKKLTRELGLNESQRERVQGIVCRTHEELMALRERSKPEKEQILRESTTAIKAELSAGQQQKFDALLEQMKARRVSKEQAAQSRPGGKEPCE